MKLLKKDIKPNEPITTYFSIESMSLRKSKSKQNFLLIELYDKTGRINGYLWDEPVVMAATLAENSYVKVRGITKIINGALVLEIERIRNAEKHEIDIRDFFEVVSGGVDLWDDNLREALSNIRDENCKRLIDIFLKDEGFMEKFKTSPGGLSVHHNYIGGLIEHTLNTMSIAVMIADNNPALIDKDILVTGSFLHDIGKTSELCWEVSKGYTTEGKLLGHISIGFLMLQQKLSELKEFPEQLALMLKHMVLSHHGALEFGSPVRPATPEALALHLIENLDAKVNHLYCHLNNADPDKQWSHFDKILNTEIYQAYSRNFKKN